MRDFFSNVLALARRQWFSSSSLFQVPFLQTGHPNNFPSCRAWYIPNNFPSSDQFSQSSAQTSWYHHHHPVLDMAPNYCLAPSGGTNTGKFLFCILSLTFPSLTEPSYFMKSSVKSCGWSLWRRRPGSESNQSSHRSDPTKDKPSETIAVIFCYGQSTWMF